MGVLVAPKAIRRDWTEANAKVEAEGGCRVGSRSGSYALCEGHVQRAHISGRRYDRPAPEGPPSVLVVKGIDICPLCRQHHEQFDAHELDLTPYLTTAEQARCVELRGGIIAALRHLSGRAA